MLRRILALTLVLALFGCASEPTPEPMPESGPTAEERADEHYQRGLEAEARGDYAAASEAYIQASSLAPGYKDVDERLPHLGAIVTAERELTESELTATPERRAEMQVRLAHALRDRPARQRDLTRAEQLFEQAALADPTNAQAYVGLGTVSAERGDLGQARERYQLAVEANPGSADAHYQLAFLIRTASQGEDDLRLALEHARKASEVAVPPEPHYYEMVATLERQLDNLDGAIAAMEQAVQLSDRPRYARRLEAYRVERDGPLPDLPPLEGEEPMILEEGELPPDMPPTEEPPAELPPAEEPPAELPPAEEPPAELPPAEEPPAELPPAEEPPAEPAPAEPPPEGQ